MAKNIIEIAGNSQSEMSATFSTASAIAAIKSEVLGQDSIIERAVATIARHLCDKSSSQSKPLILMFAGAPGVGKFTLAKSIAKHCFCDYLPNIFRMEDIPHLYHLYKCGIVRIDIDRAGKVFINELLQTISRENLFSKTVFILTSSNQAVTDVINAANDNELSDAARDELKSLFGPNLVDAISGVFRFKSLEREALCDLVGNFNVRLAKGYKFEKYTMETKALIHIVNQHAHLGTIGMLQMFERAIEDRMSDLKDQGFNEVMIRLNQSSMAVEVIGIVS